MTDEEYLAFERASPEKHAFLHGELFAMSGGTHAHSLTSSNFVREFGVSLHGRPCEAHGSDLRIHIPATGLYTYADALILCGRPEFRDGVRDTLINPVVIVEVLSDSTEAYDRGEKFEHYRSIPTLREYVLASQKRPHVEVFTRDDSGAWVLRAYDATARVVLASVDVTVAVDDVYARVFDTSANS